MSCSRQTESRMGWRMASGSFLGRRRFASSGTNFARRFPTSRSRSKT